MPAIIFRKQYKNTSAINAESESMLNISDADKTNYGPFNSIKVINKSSNDIGLRFSSGDTIHEEYIQAGETYISEGDLFNNVFIYNKDANLAIPAEKIIVMVRKIGTYGLFGGWI